ncbi:hypothetical protein [Rhodococcoides fascians]|uniref:hypothetical protein n=1 Tax=Rhodococcoides fascians TaxID=1828 RepID=UPI00068C20E6|nr:hypothetical protein [Rhodococcus fascians]
MSQIETFQKLPVSIQAIQFRDWGSAILIQRWVPGCVYVPRGAEHSMRHENEHDRSNGHVYDDIAPPFIVIPTLEGDHRADERDWIIQGVKGEFYPCKPDIFAATYKAVK